MGQQTGRPSLRDVLGTMSLSDLLTGVSSDELLAGVSRPAPTAAAPTPFDEWAQGAHKFSTRLGEPSLLPDPTQRTARPGPLAEPPTLRQIPRRDKFTDAAMDYLFRSVPSRPDGPSIFDPWYEQAADVGIPTALDVGGAIVGTLGGAAVGHPYAGGAVGSGAGNLLSQEYRQRRGLQEGGHPIETAVAIAGGAIPAIGPEGSTVLKNVAKRTAQQWGIGSTAAQAQATLEGQPLSPMETIKAGALPGLFGAVLAPAEVKAARRMAGASRVVSERIRYATPGELDQLTRHADEPTRVAAVTELLRRQREEASPGTVLRQRSEEPVSRSRPPSPDVVSRTVIDTPGTPPTGEASPPQPGFVRVYHGGVDQQADAFPRWFSTDRQYAEGYAAKSGEGGTVSYVDLPEDHPLLASEYPEQSIAAGYHRNVELPPELAAQRRLLVGDTPVSRAAAPTAEAPTTVEVERPGEGRAVPAARPAAPSIAEAPKPPIVMPPPAGRPSTTQIGEAVPYRGLKVPPLPKTLAAVTPEIAGHKVTFESPLDRAAYLLTQPKLVKHHPEALAYIQQATGLDEAAARQYGSDVATRLQDASARVPPAAAAPPMRRARVFAPMPKDLAGAKSRYGYRDRNFTPKFENPIDHAAYITAQKTPSRRDAEYLRYAMEQTGLDEAGVRAHGARVREAMKPLAKAAYAGAPDEFRVPSLWRAGGKETPVAARAPRGGLRLPAGTPPRPVLPSMTAQELLRRLQAGDQLLPTPPASDLPPEWARGVEQIEKELREFGFERGNVSYDPSGAATGSGWSDASSSRMSYEAQPDAPNLLRHTAGAPVFHEVMQGRAGNRASAQAAIEKYRAGGAPSAIADRALNVAQRRLLGDPTLSAPALPPEGPVSPRPGTDMAAFRAEFPPPPTPEAHAYSVRVQAEGGALSDQLEARFGKVYNGDDASKLLMGIDDNPHPEAWAQDYDNVRPAATTLRDEAFARRMAQPARTADPSDEFVVFTAGGTGSGKGRYIAGLKETPSVVAVLDSTLSNKAKAMQQIGQVLESGRTAVLHFIYRDPVEAFRAGVIPRFVENGRPVPIHDHVRTHLGAPELFLELAETFKDHPNVTFDVQYNGPDGQPAQGSLKWLREQASRYTDPDALTAQLRAVLAEDLAVGNLTSEQAYALGARARDFAEARRIRASRTPEGLGRGGSAQGAGGAAAAASAAPDRGPGQSRAGVGGEAPPPPPPPPGEGGGGVPPSGGEPPRPPGGGGGEPPGGGGGGEPPRPPGGEGPSGEGPLPPPGTEERTPPNQARAGRHARVLGDEIPPQRPLSKARIEGEKVFVEKTPEFLRDGIEDTLEAANHYAAQRRGVQPVERSEALSKYIEVEKKKLLPKGTTFNAEEFVAFEDLFTSTMTRVTELSELIRAGKATDADKVEHMKAVLESRVLLGNYMGARGETGRALSILKRFKYAMNAVTSDDGTGLDALIREARRAGLDPTELATTWLGLTDPLKKMQYLRSLQKPTSWDWLKGIFFSGILSGPATHMRNTIGNTTNQALRNMAMAPAYGWDVGRSALTGKERTIYTGEVKARATGAAVGAWQGIKDGLYVLRNGFSKRDLGTFDISRKELPSPSLKMFRKAPDQGAGSYVRQLGPNNWKGDPGWNPLNYVGRALEAADQFFYSIAYNSELYARLYAHAKQQGIPENLWPETMVKWKASPPKKIEKAATQAALEAVFKEKGGKFVEGLTHLKAQNPGLDFVLPFVRTPGNLMRQGFEATPLAIFTKQFREKFKAGGRDQAEAMGRMVTGTAGLAALAYFASDRLSGTGPKDPAERANLMRKGWKPNSVRIGGTWVPFTDILQPLSQPLFAVANAYEKYQKGDKIDPTHIAAAAAASLLDQSFLAGVSDLTRALTDDERYAEQFLQRWTQSTVPFSGLLRNITQAVDPVVREPEGYTQSLQSIIPGLSTRVPPKIGTLGEEVTRQGGAFTRGFSPVKPGWMPEDPVVQKLAGLGIDKLGLPPKTLQPTAEHPEITLSVAERQQLGQANRVALEQLFARPQFDAWPPGRQQEAMKDALRRARAEASEKIRRAHQSAARR